MSTALLVKLPCSNKKSVLLVCFKSPIKNINFFLYADLMLQWAKLNSNNLHWEEAELFFPSSPAVSNPVSTTEKEVKSSLCSKWAEVSAFLSKGQGHWEPFSAANCAQVLLWSEQPRQPSLNKPFLLLPVCYSAKYSFHGHWDSTISPPWKNSRWALPFQPCQVLLLRTF